MHFSAKSKDRKLLGYPVIMVTYIVTRAIIYLI